MQSETLLLPGLICNETIFAGQVDVLGHKGVRAMHGYAQCRTIEAMAERVLEQAPDRFNLCGHSMGARVALEVVRRAPEKVAKLALLDTGVHTCRPGEKEKRYALYEVGRAQGMAALVDEWLPPMVGEPARGDRALMARMHAMACGEGLEAFEAQINALLSRPEVESLLPQVSVPTLIGVGSLDIWSPPAQHEHIASLIPDSRLVVFEGAGHMAPMETPDAVTAALAEWIG
ncbi:MAG: alpha/beta hydrolase [Hyphomonas sp.]|uniref:alpha/beta fold hydrolase n=1 Tax=Hyphomonas sp. TaxID=87 RepID=UPI0017B856E5|nr:alpha/beta hydrolase [Hyphomonas sp.]MBU3922502.1 alpha/beta hydrolase [Alphaproteobacteria bacterium]MBA3066937.1 alpha/beta hydrolase [Hyphomonas sp.]MBU4060559.1 alpha/beta hydrolase [Alphaproteobacteria bacterium]MBU4165827.1 alpha/beta hydrolase [Alphaproteobacteria bacterium]MBU4568946.1 alpha/beta hydrolase [Alphaproteobacteria bacterium]